MLSYAQRKVRQWQVVEGLIYGQVKKSYRRRKLVGVTHVIRLGTGAALKSALQGMGFSGQLHTAFIERVNLTVRHGVAALARRTWATSQQAPQLLARLEWRRAYYHFVHPHASLRLALVHLRERGGTALSAAYPSYGSGENYSTVDSAGSALLSLATSAMLHNLSVNEARRHPRSGSGRLGEDASRGACGLTG